MTRFFVCSCICFGLCFGAPKGLSANRYNTLDSSILKRNYALLHGVHITGYAAGMSGLYFLWYHQYPQSSFHWHNDNQDWLQMDKVGHFYSAYMLAKSSSKLWKAAGVNPIQAQWHGAAYTLLFLSTIEVFDGFSAEWGASSGDVVANLAGVSLGVAQGYMKHPERIQMKFSFSKSGLAGYRPELLGGSFIEQMFKDYNGQTYWLSYFPFQKSNHLPLKLLGFSIGYGAYGMLGAHENPVFSDAAAPLPYFPRYRQWYFSFDVDVRNIPTQKKWLKGVLYCVNALKFPMPAVSFGNGSIRGHAFYF